MAALFLAQMASDAENVSMSFILLQVSTIVSTPWVSSTAGRCMSHSKTLTVSDGILNNHMHIHIPIQQSSLMTH